MPVFTGHWSAIIWADTRPSDVEFRLESPLAFWQSLGWFISGAPQPTVARKRPVLHHPEGIRLLSFHQHWLEMANRTDLSRLDLSSLITSIESYHADLQQLAGHRFVVPFPVFEKIWIHDNHLVREEGSRLLPVLEASFAMHPRYEEDRHDDERLAFISALTKHLNRTDGASYLSTSIRSQKFIRFVHDQIIS
ncbi:hypothetical protein Moror_7058 [Moniliophthora roreri MCA 2997]|uniref:Uncharacterized protein n=1 Tax=Moniliophthora roreri (strain MCA 2997) TaxID=1381753 RepID=V2XRB4_MONRO|nr:hypothetical protein Moror_7058 [Moniliophthora roreri MCA 2997]